MRRERRDDGDREAARTLFDPFSNPYFNHTFVIWYITAADMQEKALADYNAVTEGETPRGVT